MVKYSIGILALVFCLFVYKTLFNDPSRNSPTEKVQLAVIKITNLIFKDYYTDQQYSLPNERNNIVHLWASWCEPCVVEFPEIIKHFEEIKSHSNLYLVSLDSNTEDLDRFLSLFPDLKAKRIPVILDKDKSISKLFNVSKLPKTVLVEKGTGNFIKTIEGLTDWKALSLSTENTSE